MAIGINVFLPKLAEFNLTNIEIGLFVKVSSCDFFFFKKNIFSPKLVPKKINSLNAIPPEIFRTLNIWGVEHHQR